MISRKTTKIAVFCSWVGSTRVESCCTSPIVRPPQNAPMMLPMPPSTTPGIHDDDVLEADEGLERIVGGEQAAGDAR